jgi:hypothetical protein
MKKKTHIVQFQMLTTKKWVRSLNRATKGQYTKESAQKRAKREMTRVDFPYRIKKVKT